MDAPVDVILNTKRIRRRALAIAVVLHVSIGGYALHLWAKGLTPSIDTAIEPLVTSELVKPIEEAAQNLPAMLEAPEPVMFEQEMAVEPDEGIVATVASKILDFENSEFAGLSLADVRERAAMLERISSREAIDQMAVHLRSAIGTQFGEIKDAGEDAPPVNWNDALPVGAEQIEIGDRIEIHETYVDPAGGKSVMVTIREPDSKADDYQYFTVLIEGGVQGDPVLASKEAFDNAVSRAKPFAIINDYPLLRELHRSAVLPILHKLVAEEEAKERQTRTATTGTE